MSLKYKKGHTMAAVEQLHGEVFADRDTCRTEIKRVGKQIIQAHQGNSPLMVGLLNGGGPFTTRLAFEMDEMDRHFQPWVEYMKVNRYREGREAGELQIHLDLDDDLVEAVIDAEVKLILVDDLKHDGKTLMLTKEHIVEKGVKPENIQTAVLVERIYDNPESQLWHPDFVAISYHGDEWLTGFGMDDKTIPPDGNRWGEFVAIANPKPEPTNS